ncbi:MAG: GTP 3',8-cyclase MoaA [Candidatus Helarchaeota archaeon]|nr:GTP 3',8-cyclase MoaA [Candidatus Helarchaeota archaeon]
MLDKFNRPLTAIRISITQRCNLDCIYCHHEGENARNLKEMIVDEIIKVVRISTQFGITKVKYTGGEPLLRNDLIEIIQKTRNIPKISDISVVTNGILLEKYAKKLCNAGLDRINVSLDTLCPETYANITKHSGKLIDQVEKGIIEALNCGIAPIKLNMVLLKGVNEAEIEDLIAFTKNRNLILQLIELVPLSNSELFNTYHVNLTEIEENLKTQIISTKIRDMQNRKKYFLENGAEIEMVKPFHNSKFCANCHRIRITSTGMIKPCLMRNDNLIDILTPIRKGVPDEKLYKLFQHAIDLREPYCK